MADFVRKEGARRGPRLGGDLKPLEGARIVAAAVELTSELGLSGWSLRRLADTVGCWPTAITHHLGGRYELELAVVDQVVGMIPVPDAKLDWRGWFTELLVGLRPVLRAHPGVAGWLALCGPVVRSAQRFIDEGVRRLAAVGLGDEAVAAYTVMLNSAVQLIAVEDERDARPDLRRETARCFEEGRELPGVAAMATAYATGWDNERVYRYGVDRLLDGIEARIRTS